MRASARAILCLALLLPAVADEPSAALRGATPEPTAVGKIEQEDELQPLRQRYAEDIAALPPGESLIVCRGVTVCRRWGVVRGVRTCQGGFYCRSGAEVLAVSGDADAGEAEEPEEAQEPVEKASVDAAQQEDGDMLPLVSTESLWSCRGVRVCRGGWTWRGRVRVCRGGFFCRPY